MDYSIYEDYGPQGFQAELEEFARHARQMIRIQERNRRKSGEATAARGFHAKQASSVDKAELTVDEQLPHDLRQDCFQPGSALRAFVRFSNGAGMHQADGAKDIRGIAVRISAPDDDHVHDLLMTNFETPPAANAREFMAMARAVAGLKSAPAKAISMVLRLPPQVGLPATVRILCNLARSGTEVDSLATQKYWSRGAIGWGEAGPVRYRLRPLNDVHRTVGPGPDPARGDDALRIDLQERLRTGPVEFALEVQRFVSQARTPIEDVSKRWRNAPWIRVGRLVIPQQDLDTAPARRVEREVNGLAFNPWNTPPDFRPLGNLHRARRAVYEASAAHRRGQRFEGEVRPAQAVADAVAGGLFGLLGPRVRWYQLPTRLSLLKLAMLRRQLREDNLIDGTPPPRCVDVRRRPEAPAPAAVRVQRNAAGCFNDLSAPAMGSQGSAFGRNMPVDRDQSAEVPHPRDVSDLLMARERFVPATSLNTLAAAWIQFQVHDWANHARFLVSEHSTDLPPRPGRNEPVMRIGADRGSHNLATHWWDGSEVYGTPAVCLPYGGWKGDMTAPRAGDSAELALDEHGCLPLNARTGVPHTDFGEAWWLGLSTLQTVMTREHNAVCDALRREYPNLSEDRIFQIARLVVSALIAKIHTVEWTPAILGTKTLDLGMNVVWSGAPKDWLTALGIRLLEPGQLHGTAGTLPDHHGVPFALTEEFVTVYRMHQLVPDDFVFVKHDTGEELGDHPLPDILGKNGEDILRKYGLADVLYSFATASPGAVTLHNFPEHLRHFTAEGGNEIDLAAVDVLRTRLRGVPRYNDFRERLHMPRLRDFTQVTDDPYSLARLKRVYGAVDEIDTVVGLLAEKPPPGFGFSDTAFRVFLLMATRRLQSDRFLTVDFRPEIYTELGMDWIARGSFGGVLLRHCPELAAVIGRSGKGVFAPWP